MNRSLVSYYGGKGKLWRYYQAPLHDTIIEPFAGGANYSLQYADRQVILNDRDPAVAAMWRFLLRPEALDVINARVPAFVQAGSRITDFLEADADPGLRRFVIMWAARGSHGNRDVVSAFAARSWGRLFAHAEHYLPRIGHWVIQEGDYSAVSNQPATWFIDPPYSTHAGRCYEYCDIDYAALRAWTIERQGQLIVCGETSEDWLQFTPLMTNSDKMNRHSGRRTYVEGVYAREF